MTFSAKAEQRRRQRKLLIALSLRQPQKCRKFSAANKSQPDPLTSLKYPQLPLVFKGAENHSEPLGELSSEGFVCATCCLDQDGE